MTHAEWTKKRKGSAIVHMHPTVDQAVVEGPWGVSFAGRWYATVADAQRAALVNAGVTR